MHLLFLNPKHGRLDSLAGNFVSNLLENSNESRFLGVDLANNLFINQLSHCFPFLPEPGSVKHGDSGTSYLKWLLLDLNYSNNSIVLIGLSVIELLNLSRHPLISDYASLI